MYLSSHHHPLRKVRGHKSVIKELSEDAGLSTESARLPGSQKTRQGGKVLKRRGKTC